MKKIALYILIIQLSVMFAGMNPEANAQVNNRQQIGARPMGMGGAFSAIANDGNSIYWNPAGLAWVQRQEITTMYSDLFGLGLGTSYLGYVLPLTDNLAIGTDWLHVGQDDSGLSFAKNYFDVSAGYRLPWWNLSLGANFKYNSMDIQEDGVSYGNPSGTGFDFGLLFNPSPRYRFAITGTDIGNTKHKFDNDREEDVLYQQFKFAAAFFPFSGMIVAADVDDRIHLGSEYWLTTNFAVRGGLQKDIKKVDGYNRGLIYSTGISAKYKFLQFDYAIEVDPDLPMTHMFGISFFYNPSLVSIKSASIKPIPMFRSLYKKYSEEDFAEVELKNSSQEKLPVRVRIDIPTVIEQPYETEIVLDPQSTKSYPIKVAFSNNVVQSKGAGYDNLVQPTVTVTYTQDKQEKEAARNLDPLYVLGKNKISWSEPERVASFITPEDETVDKFTRSIVQAYNEELVENYSNSNIGKASVLFDALGAHGLVYQADRSTPWYLISSDSTIFDNIQYPSEMLNSKIGDCDDCTVLFASMLGNLNIETALLDVDAPGAGHIYMMFDSGIPLDEIQSQPISENEYVVYKNKAWIPVETTMYGHSFTAAWRNGAEEYQLRKSQGFINEIDVNEAKQKFMAGQPNSVIVEPPTKEEMSELYSIDLEAYDTRLEQFAFASGVSMDDPDGVYDAGAAYMRFKRFDDAERMMIRATELKPDFGDALNALGVIYVNKGDFEKALTFLRRAVAAAPADAGIRLNIAISLYLQGKADEASEEYGKAIEMDQAFKDMLKFIQPKKKDKD